MINIIAAIASNNVIGKNNTIPWDLPEDRQFFKEITMGGVLVMGRNTYESIGRPLPGRNTIVVSSRGIDIPDEFSEDLTCVQTLNQAISFSQDKEVFLCGGAGIYREGLSLANTLYITKVELDIDGDTFFPENYEDGFTLIERRRLSSSCTLMIYARM